MDIQGMEDLFPEVFQIYAGEYFVVFKFRGVE